MHKEIQISFYFLHNQHYKMTKTKGILSFGSNPNFIQTISQKINSISMEKFIEFLISIGQGFTCQTTDYGSVMKGKLLLKHENKIIFSYAINWINAFVILKFYLHLNENMYFYFKTTELQNKQIV